MSVTNEEPGRAGMGTARRDLLLLLFAIVVGGIWGAGTDMIPDGWRESVVSGSGMRLLGWSLVGVLSVGLLALIVAVAIAVTASGSWRMATPTGAMGSAATDTVRPQETETTTQPPAATVRQMPVNPEPEASLDKHTAKYIRPQSNEPAVTDRYFGALGFLGSDAAASRIGALLALEQSAAERPSDLRPVLGTIAGYVLECTASPSDDRPAVDVMVAMSVLCRMLPTGDPVRTMVDLHRAGLAGLEMPETDFSRFRLTNIDLAGADLRGVIFSGANLRGAELGGALLSGAIFDGASLREANLTGAVLSDLEYGPAKLGAAGNLQPSQLRHVRYDPKVTPTLPPGFDLPAPGIFS